MSSAAARRRLKLWIAYDGRPFSGWQSQAGGNTVQDHLESAFQKIAGEKVGVHGAGRTDAGVHALRQCAHVDVRKTLPLSDWLAALNSALPREIRVLSLSAVRNSFHARFSAKGKVYVYRIWNAPVQSPFELGRSWHLTGDIDIDVLKRCAEQLIGTHDFSAFAANRGKPSEDTVRTIHRIDVRRRGCVLTLTFQGDGFLYRMVRLMTGTMMRCAQRRADPTLIERLLSGQGKSSFAAPAEGLYLARVIY
jgi:tRNA pseudouridine38-40 synthase